MRDMILMLLGFLLSYFFWKLYKKGHSTTTFVISIFSFTFALLKLLGFAWYFSKLAIYPIFLLAIIGIISWFAYFKFKKSK